MRFTLGPSAGVVIVGPFFSGGRMRTKAEDHQLAGDQHLRNDLLVSAALEIGAGMDRVFAGPASRSKQRVQAIRVGPLIGVGDHVAAQFAILRGIRYSPVDHRGIKGNLQGRTEVLGPPRPQQDLLHGRLGDSWVSPSVEFRKPNKGRSHQNVVVVRDRIYLESRHLAASDWKILYRAAILETNKCVLPQRVSEAEEAVILRRRELFYGNGDPEEEEALDDALYALRAFKTAWQ